jgi:hypothetical protein
VLTLFEDQLTLFEDQLTLFSTFFDQKQQKLKIFAVFDQKTGVFN